MAKRPSPWIFVAIALVIALTAFEMGQWIKGAGMVLILGASIASVMLAQKLYGKKACG